MNARRQKRLNLEALEERCVPAGNVTATLHDSAVLSIVGDCAGNSIRVEVGQSGDTVSPKYVRIDALDDTLVNGQTSALFEVPGGLTLKMDLRDGADSVDAAILLTTGGLNFLDIDTGHGDDVVDVSVPGGGFLWGFWAIDTGNGNDRVSIRGAATETLLDSLTIRTGNGDDQVAFDGAFVARPEFRPSLSLGLGDDALIGGTVGSFSSSLSITGGNGLDTVINAAYFAFFQTQDPLTLDFEEVVS